MCPRFSTGISKHSIVIRSLLNVIAGEVVRSWKRRYFALGAGCLFYFVGPDECDRFKRIAGHSQVQCPLCHPVTIVVVFDLLPSSSCLALLSYLFSDIFFSLPLYPCICFLCFFYVHHFLMNATGRSLLRAATHLEGPSTNFVTHNI